MKNKNFFFRLAFAVFVVFFSYLENIYAETSIYELQGKKIIYINDNNLIIADGGAYAKDQSGKKILADKITYNKKKQLLRPKAYRSMKITREISCSQIIFITT